MHSDPIFTAAGVPPTPDVLERELGDRYAIYERSIAGLGSPAFDVRPEWRSYRDGGAWLCKLTRKTKTVGWLSAWRSCLKVAFYFTARTGDGIAALPIDEALKTAYANAAPVGKLVPLLIEVRSEDRLDDVFAVAAYTISRA